MGNFYVNHTVRGPDVAAVVEALKDREAFISPSQNDCVVVFEQRSDYQDVHTIQELGKQLSTIPNTTVLAVLNHDDDILVYWLMRDGDIIDTYDSSGHAGERVCFST